MANELDELTGPFMEEGNEVKVIAKRLPVTVGAGSKVFDVIWWFLPPIIGGIIWLIVKVKAKNYLQQLQQKLQHDASQIDNYLEQRVQILKNCARLVDKAVELDKSTFTDLAKYRSGNGLAADEIRNDYASKINSIGRNVNIVLENYPELAAHKEIKEAMQQNSYLQREITAAREVYNDTVGRWNKDIYSWPAKQIVAAKEGYTTRLPFIADAETKEQARGNFF